MKKIPKALQIGIKAIISIAFFSVLLSFVRANALFSIFAHIDWSFFAISFGVSICMFLVSCSKWKSILDIKDPGISFRELLKIYLIGYFFSNILPSTIGGDVARLYYAGKLIKNQAYAAVSVFVERFSGMVLLFLLVALAPLIQIDLYTNLYILVPACAGLFCLGLTLWVWKAQNPFAGPNKIAEISFATMHKISQKRYCTLLIRPVVIIESLYLKSIERLKKVRSELQISTDAIKQNKRFFWRIVLLTMLFYLLSWVNVYTAFKAFHIEVSFFAICAIVPAIMLVAHVPVTLLGNLGYFESVYVFYFLLVGIGGAETLAMGLFLRLKMLSMGGVGFVVYLVYRQKHRLDIGKGENDA